MLGITSRIVVTTVTAVYAAFRSDKEIHSGVAHPQYPFGMFHCSNSLYGEGGTAIGTMRLDRYLECSIYVYIYL